MTQYKMYSVGPDGRLVRNGAPRGSGAGLAPPRTVHGTGFGGNLSAPNYDRDALGSKYDPSPRLVNPFAGVGSALGATFSGMAGAIDQHVQQTYTPEQLRKESARTTMAYMDRQSLRRNPNRSWMHSVMGYWNDDTRKNLDSLANIGEKGLQAVGGWYNVPIPGRAEMVPIMRDLTLN